MTHRIHCYFFAAVLLLCSVFAHGQNLRWDLGAPGSAGAVTVGAGSYLTALGGVQLNWCNFPANAIPCTNFANTYPTSSSSSPCPTNTQIVLQGSSTCVQFGDNFGNLGVYTAQGTYAYTLTVNGVTSQPYKVNVGAPALNVPGSFAFSVTGGVVAAINNITGAIVYSGTDAAVALNGVFASAPGGTVSFREGFYPINSLTQETFNGIVNGITANFSNYYYGIGFPSATASSAWLHWKLVSESGTPRVFNYTDTGINNNGVIFYVTPAAVASVGGSANIVGIWQRPSPQTFFSGEIELDGITVRFPTNTRGNELAFGFYAAGSLILRNYLADFNLSYDTIYNGSTPAAGSFGVGTQYGSSSNTAILEAGSVVGYQYCYDFQGEHLNVTDVNAQECQYAAIFSRSLPSAQFHPNELTGFIDQENQNGPVLNGNFGTEVDFYTYDIEDAPTGTFARQAYFHENTPGNTTGILTYTAVLGGSGYEVIVPWSNGGSTYLTASGNGWIGGGLGPGAHPFASWPTCSSGREGLQALISNSSNNTYGSTANGSGASHVFTICNGTNYIVH